MKLTKKDSRVARGVSVALSLMLVAGAALVATAPVQATAGPIQVHATDIAPNENTYTGWHQGYVGATSPTNYSITSEGLQLSGASQIIDGLATPLNGTDFTNALSAGQVSWTTTSNTARAFFQLPMFYGTTSPQSFTTLRPAAPVPGTNTADYSQLWVSSHDLTGIPKNTPALLSDLLSAMDVTTIQVLGFGVLTEVGTTSVVTGITFNGSSYEFVQPALATGTVTVSGNPIVGSTLTANSAGWPLGTTFVYSWFWDGGQMGGEIGGANSPTYTVSSDYIGRSIGVIVTGTVAGFQSSYVRSDVTAAVTAPQKPAASAPVPNSTDLPAYLTTKSVTVQPSTTAGLPAGDLDPSKPHTATLTWTAPDSFVDVYLFSTPTFVGTFPVVNGVAQITLSASVLSKLAAGTHTLVFTGQSSGTVQAVSLSLASVLAATGSDVAVPLTLGALLLALGAALIIVRRRRLHA